MWLQFGQDLFFPFLIFTMLAWVILYVGKKIQGLDHE